MVVLAALCASIYAAALIPFKIFTIIPGYTELRPACALPIVLSLMFGPAAAWGTGFGNLIGDFFGTLGPGSFFGFFGNFLYGFIPYKLWRLLRREEPVVSKGTNFLAYLSIILISSIACGTFIGWGIELLGLLPFSTLAPIIAVNNFFLSLILGPLLLLILYGRVKRLGLIYPEVMGESLKKCGGKEIVGIVLLWCGGVGGMVTGCLGFSATPFIGLILLSIILL
jgi:energy-coupling factor transport system substrate-specific component